MRDSAPIRVKTTPAHSFWLPRILSRSRRGLRLLRNWRVGLGVTSALGLVIAALFAGVISPYDPYAADFTTRLTGPSLSHPMGADHIGRDVFSRVVYGSRIALLVGFGTVSIAASLGLALGLVWGHQVGLMDHAIGRLVDSLLAFPPLVLVIILSAIFKTDLLNIVVAIGIVYFPVMARVVRSQVISIREQDFITAALASGVPPLRIMVRHVLPNTLAPVLVVSSLQVGNAILAEAGLSYLGLGVQPPTAAWGSMVLDAQPYLERAPWAVLGPGAAIFIAVLALNVLGDGLRDELDPRLR